MRITFLIFSFFLFFSACYYDKQNAIKPNLSNSCDTSGGVLYKKQVSAIISSQCLSCHSGSRPNADLNLESYSSVVNAITQKNLVKHLKSESGFSPMPPAGKIRDCEILLIEKWINAGKPE